MPMKSTDKAFTLRLPDDLYEAMQLLAKENERSMNGEIILAIKKHLAEQQEQSKG